MTRRSLRWFLNGDEFWVNGCNPTRELRLLNFAVGEKVVYPTQGVGTIENIATRYFAQKPEKFYLLRLFCSSMTVMVPFSTAQSIGLRRLSRGADVNRVLTYLASPAVEDLADWKIRFRVNSEKL